MDRFFVIINESNENAWSAYVWSDVKEQAVILYDNNVLRSSSLKKLKKLHFGNKFNGRVWLPLKSVWNRSLSLRYEDLKATDRNILIFQSSVKFSPGFIRKLKREKNAVIVQYLPDTLEKLGIADSAAAYERYKRYYGIDLTYSFDQNDCVRYGMEFFDIYSSKAAAAQPREDLYDIFYVGSARTEGRLELLHSVTERTEGLRGCFYMIGVDSDKQRCPERVTYNQPLRYGEVVEKTLNSNCILELMNDNQAGNTLRFKEAVCYNKKLLTNNRAAFDSPYYDERYIRVFDDVSEIDPEWIAQKCAVDYRYGGEYSPQRLLEMIIGQLDGRHE